MQKRAMLQSVLVLVGVLLLMAIAYWHSMEVSRLYDNAMHRDIQQFTDALGQGDVPRAQAQALTAVLDDVHRNTLSYISSVADSLIGTIAFTGVLVMSAVLGLAARSAKDAGSAG